MTDARPRLSLLAAALLFATGGAAIKAIQLTAWQVASFRSAVAAAALLLLLPASRRLGRPRVFLVGAAFAATMILFVSANKNTTAAAAIYLQATAPIYVAILAPLLLKERLRRIDLLFTLPLFLGLVLVVSGGDAPQISAPRPGLGNLFAAASGLTWALTLIGLRALGRDGTDDAGPAAVVGGSLIACGVALPFALPVETTPTVTDFALIAYLGVFQIGLAYVFLTRGIGRVAAFEASLLLLVEPVLNPFIAWIVHHESPTPRTLVGCSVILAATFGRAALDTRGRTDR